jgi:hypothetical protein
MIFWCQGWTSSSPPALSLTHHDFWSGCLDVQRLILVAKVPLSFSTRSCIDSTFLLIVLKSESMSNLIGLCYYDIRE